MASRRYRWSHLGHRDDRDPPVFDRGETSPRFSQARGRFSNSGGPEADTAIRRTARDAQPASSVVTSALMGDPPPGRGRT